MRSIYYITLLLAFVAFSCKQSEKSEPQPVKKQEMEMTMKNISIEEAAEKIAEGQAIFIDVRTPEEIADGMIPGSVHLDYKSSDFKSKLAELDRDKEYVIYCRSGGRSAKACDLMKEMGFSNLSNMEGGFTKWKKG